VRIRLATPVLLLALAAAAEEKPSPTPESKDAAFLTDLYYDADSADGAWGKANGLGLVFRKERGLEVCHVLFFGEGREIVQEKALPVVRKDGTVLIGEVACGWDANAKELSLILPGGRRLPPDGESMIRAALQESPKCRYLLTKFVTAEALAAAEAKDAPKDEEALWKKLCGLDYNLKDFGDAGQGLRFFEDKDGRKCLVVRFGSGVPVTGKSTMGVKIVRNEVTIGERLFRIDPASMSLTEVVKGKKEGKPSFPDRFILDSMLKANEDNGKR